MLASPKPSLRAPQPSLLVPPKNKGPGVEWRDLLSPDPLGVRTHLPLVTSDDILPHPGPSLGCIPAHHD